MNLEIIVPVLFKQGNRTVDYVLVVNLTKSFCLKHHFFLRFYCVLTYNFVCKYVLYLAYELFIIIKRKQKILLFIAIDAMSDLFRCL